MQSILLTNIIMNNLGFEYLKNVDIDTKAILEFVLSYRMVVVSMVYLFSVIIVFWSLYYVTFFVLIITCWLKCENVLLETFKLFKLVKEDHNTFYFYDHDSYNILKEYFQYFNNFTVDNFYLKRINSYSSIFFVSCVFYWSFHLDTTFPEWVTDCVNISFWIFLIYHILTLTTYCTIAPNIEKIYFELLKNEYNNPPQ